LVDEAKALTSFVRSISKTGLSIITVVFAEGTDIYFARQLVFERLQDAKEQIPADVGTPEMGPNTSGLGQVFQYILRADDPERFDTMALRSLNDWVVKLLLMPRSRSRSAVSISVLTSGILPGSDRYHSGNPVARSATRQRLIGASFSWSRL
jgi:hypothetical protein